MSGKRPGRIKCDAWEKAVRMLPGQTAEKKVGAGARVRGEEEVAAPGAQSMGSDPRRLDKEGSQAG